MALVLHRFTTPDALNKAFAKQIINSLRKAIAAKGQASLVVSGGSTPKPLFVALSETAFEWDKVVVTLADERWVDANHADSNEKLVRENLLQNKASAATFVSLTTRQANAEDAESEISQRIDNMDENFDVVILGMGEDGHTASLFPCSSQLSEGLNLSRELSVIATQPTSAPHQRMSMSLAKIISAKKVFLHLTGPKKKAVLEDALANFTELEKPIKAVCNRATVNLMWAP
ncbi:MAG: 6-phosphogluconolactonase [Alphaproteobacteria bacterium]|jgi:6-phosphogluconolactonase